MSGEGKVLEAAELVCHVLLIETEGAGLVLVDTGIGAADVADPGRLGGMFRRVFRPRLRAEETALARIEALGFSAADVRHLVLTHMDIDHASGMADFPEATVHVLADEHAAATTRRRLAERSRYRPVQWAHGPKFETYEPAGEAWFGFACVRELRGLPPELLMIPLSGHSRGHAGIAVQGPDGWLLHAGDAYFHAGQMERPPRCPPALSVFQKAVAVDREALRENQDRLRELVGLHGDEVEVFSAHDPRELARMQARVGADPQPGAADSASG